MTYLWKSATAVLALTIAHPAYAAVCSADLPMRFYGNGPAAEVMVNGKGPFLFHIDTAASGMGRADLSLVKTLALRSTGQAEATDGSSDKFVLVDKYVLDEVRLGDMIVQRVSTTARDYNRTPHLPDIAGILGFGFFKDCLLTLDYKAKRIRVRPGALPPANRRDILEFKDDGGPFVAFSIGQVATSAIIDSGSQLGVLLPTSMVKRLPLASYRKTVGKGKTVTNEFDISEVMVQDTLAIGGYRIKKPTINFAANFNEVVIGSAALQGLILTFDQKNKRVRIKH